MKIENCKMQFFWKIRPFFNFQFILADFSNG